MPWLIFWTIAATICGLVVVQAISSSDDNVTRFGIMAMSVGIGMAIGLLFDNARKPA
jgi:prephenate dehydratase